MTLVVLGVWPLAGITSGIVEPQVARQTVRAAFDAGIDTFDTAYSYGYQGEAELRLGEALREQRRSPTATTPRVIGKVGQRWTADRKRYTDGTPRQLIADAEESLRRLQIPHFDHLLLHAVDPQVDIRRSAEALDGLRRRGLALEIGVSNANVDELIAFASCVPCSSLQCPLNLLQPQSLDPLITTANRLGVGTFAYWVLMKGMLAGKISREHAFPGGDSRPNYDIFQGATRQRAHDVVERLQAIAADHQTTVAELAIGWALSQPGVRGALVGAKSPEQIRETAEATPLAADLLAKVNQLVS